jgi:hypothetical protein
MIQSGRQLGTSIAIGSFALLIGLAAPISSAAADSPGPASVAPPPAADAPQIEHVEYWRARGDQARAHVAAARERLDEANAAVSRMQRRNHPRGEARIALRNEQAAAREAHEAAVRALEVDLPAEARTAGASTRWLQADG